MIITAVNLKFNHNANNPNSSFFDKSTMKYFGDTMSNYSANSERHMIPTSSGEAVPCYALTRKKPVKTGLQDVTYFAMDDFRRVHKIDVSDAGDCPFGAAAKHYLEAGKRLKGLAGDKS